MKLTSSKILTVGCAVVLIMWGGYASVKMGRNVQTWGAFGDKFGALNTLFTGLAFVGLVATLWHQRESGEQQQTEHKATLAAMQRQADGTASAVEAMRDQIRESVRPFVSFDVVPRGFLIEAQLKNSGRTPAHGVKIESDPVLQTCIGGTTKAAKLALNAIPLLVPGREVVEFLGSWDDIKNYSRLRWTGTLRYSDSTGFNYSEPFTVDLSVLDGMPYLGRPDVGTELQTIARSLATLAASPENAGSAPFGSTRQK